MQVFLPDRDFAKCAEVLDTKRLVKQLLEGRQILQTLSGESAGWKSHPAVKMFIGHEGVLYMYLSAIRDEMEKRGYKWENNWEVIQRVADTYFPNQESYILPWWFDDEYLDSVVITHRGRLYAKAPDLYPQYELEYNVHRDYVCCDKCNYYWPTHNTPLFHLDWSSLDKAEENIERTTATV